MERTQNDFIKENEKFLKMVYECNEIKVYNNVFQYRWKKYQEETKILIENELNLIREETILKFGNKCELCGIKYNGSNHCIFDYHHINPEQKEKLISILMRDVVLAKNKTVPKQKLDNELLKCKLLCKNCHAIEHKRLRDLKNKKNFLEEPPTYQIAKEDFDPKTMRVIK